ncbi:Hypothetical Protein FCC1311_019082 [Hondaea fermentalgiana]|uniref:Uncharacterized protein n=1 Tax=Hondaea fermentalgiana TaxID=2315210 RepID=A0A2R5G5R9_9STRA|nr:Hypothetical Protein FCC1311_019082 [Hondaea fermentalgiana]|eukprot:GBG25689.1 Hypothetical Protein FCC1311_019082 [Hondaea fermentalgiana]
MTSRLRQPHIVRELRDGKVSPQGSPQQVGAGSGAPHRKLTPVKGLGGSLAAMAAARDAATGAGSSFIQQVSPGGRLAGPFKALTYALGFGVAMSVAFMTQPNHSLIGTDNCFSSVHKWALVKRDQFFGVETPREVLENPSADLKQLRASKQSGTLSYSALDEAYEIARLRHLLDRDNENAK